MTTPKVPSLRCPKHDEWYVVDTQKKAGAPLGAFIQRHNGCGALETYEGDTLKGHVVPPGSLPN